MNAKKAKVIRKLCEVGGLDYHKQKKIFSLLTKKEQEQYISDARLHIQHNRNIAVEKMWESKS